MQTFKEKSKKKVLGKLWLPAIQTLHLKISAKSCWSTPYVLLMLLYIHFYRDKEVFIEATAADDRDTICKLYMRL